MNEQIDIAVDLGVVDLAVGHGQTRINTNFH
jgi:hypothetical protein